VAAKPEIRRVVRCRTREFCDRFSGQSYGICKTDVTGRAGLARHIHVRRLQSVTIKTLSNDRVLHCHPYSPGLVMACGTIADQTAVRRILCGSRAIVRLMGEPKIAGTRSCPRLPAHFAFYHSVVARRATNRIGPD
jgi:hypothetical protein